MEAVDHTDMFEAERPRLVGIASRVLSDHAEAQDIVQQAWLRLNATDAEIDSLPAWLTTVTTRLCLDRLRSRTPVPVGDVELRPTVNDPADDVALAETVGLALTLQARARKDPALSALSDRIETALAKHRLAWVSAEADEIASRTPIRTMKKPKSSFVPSEARM